MASTGVSLVTGQRLLSNKRSKVVDHEHVKSGRDSRKA